VRKLLLFTPILYLIVLLFQVDLGMVEDLGRHLKMGEIVWSTHQVPNVNLFSWRAENFQIVNHEWLTQVIFYLTFNFFGYSGLLLLKMILVIGAIGIMYLLALKKYPSFWVSIVGIFCIAVFASRFRVRPELVSYLFMALLYFLFDKFSTTRNIRWLYFLPLIMMLWVNMHIFFGLGLFMIGVFMLENYLNTKKFDKKLFAICVISGLGTLLNPSGINGVLLPFTIFQNYNFVVEENHSPFKIFSTTSGFVYTLLMQVYLFEILAVMTIIGSLFILKKKNILYPVNGIVNAILGLRMVRNISLLGIAGFFPLIEIFSGIEKKLGSEGRKKIMRASFVLFAVVFVCFHIKGLFENKIFSFSFRTYAENGSKFFVDNKIDGPIFNNYMIGNHLIFWLYPENHVFVDARPEAYPGNFFDEYNRMLTDGEFFDAQTEKFGINAVVMGVQDDPNIIRPFMLRLIQNPNWVPVYADGNISILVKNSENNKEVISKYGIIPR